MTCLQERVRLDEFRGVAAVGGFSYADVPESAKGWAATILFNDGSRNMFDDFYSAPILFRSESATAASFSDCLAGCRGRDIEPERQPRFVGKYFRSFRVSMVNGQGVESKAMMLEGHGRAGIRNSC